MKAWSDDHPKAKIMARKRAAILKAAEEAFLRVGYDGASMEGIAATAEVSIMTLYRHVNTKDELFAAVITRSCEDSDEGRSLDPAELMSLPLQTSLVAVGEAFLEKITRRDTVGLLRAVMIETARFPHLAEAAYTGFVEKWEINLDSFLSQRPEFADVAESIRRELISSFMDDLLSRDILRVLLGHESATTMQHSRRAADAADRFNARLLGG